MTTVDGLKLRRVFGRDEWCPPKPFGPDGWRMLHRNGSASVIATAAEFDDITFVHASIADSVVLPSYADLVVLHKAVFGDGYAYQVFAPALQHVNIHPNALHLWGRADGLACLPEFGFAGSI